MILEDSFDYGLIPNGAKVLCALSGGADSMYLISRLLERAEVDGYTICAAHMNHGLRPTARRDQEFVRSWCRQRHIQLALGYANVEEFARAWKLGVEEAARECRYAFFDRTARRLGCTHIATGHQASDNAETVLMNLMRGCGLRGLTGIPKERGNIIRPMLGVTREEIDRYLAEHDIPHVEDETNRDLTLLRNRVRHQLLPLMEEMNPQVMAHINEMTSNLRFDERCLRQQAEELVDACVCCEGGIVSIEGGPMGAAPVAVGVRAADILLRRAGLGHDSSQLKRIYQMAEAICCDRHHIDRTQVPGGEVRRDGDRLVFTRRDSMAPRPEAPLAQVPLMMGEQRWGQWRISCGTAVCPPEPGTPASFFLKSGLYTIRSRQTGDGLRPPNRVYKTLKKWMVEQKIPRAQRDRVPVLAFGERAVAAGGVGVDRDFAARPGEPALHITWAKENDI